MATFEDAAKEEILTPNPEDNPRNKRMMEIASSEEESKEGLEDVADGDHDKTVPVEEPVEEKAPLKFKIKANGKEEELTQEELIKRAELATGAEQKFQEAARLRKEAEELRAVPPKEEQAVDEDDRALARALQMGNEEEAAAVIRKIRTRPSQDADVDRRIDQRMEFRNSAAWFQQEYPDIVKDPNLLSLVLSEDEKLVKGGDKRSYKDRYGQIGDGLRKWMSGLKAPASTEERRERKANLQVVPSASVRAGAPVEDNDGPDDREFIAAEAKGAARDIHIIKGNNMAGQVWAVNSLGGFMYSRQLSNVLRMAVQPLVKFRQFCDVRDASQQGRKKGDIFTWDVFSDVAAAGGVLTETNTMPETNYTIIQGTLTITEAGNSIPYSGKLDNLSKFPVMDLIQKVLKNDTVKTLDILAWKQFNATLLKATPTGGTNTATVSIFTNGTSTFTNSVAYNNNHAKSVVDQMKERNIPAYLGDDYYALAWPTTLRSFKNNLETIHQYSDTGFKLIMNGEIGRYENVRYIEQTNIAKGTGSDGTTTTAWTGALSDWIFFFGNDTVAEAIAVPEEMRGKIPTDYGRSKGVAWYYLGGFGIVHASTSAASNARIVKWDTAL